MYTNSAYWKNTRIDFKDKTHPLFVGSCGTYRLYTRPKLPTHRPKGRLDYQLLYVASGKAHFYFNDTKKIITAGNMILYRPKEEQRYYYYGIDQPEVYWVHFTGSNVKNLLRQYGIADDMQVIHTGTSLEFKRIFLTMIQELQLCKEDYEDLLTHLMYQLLILIHRQITARPKEKSAHLMNEIHAAIQYFQENYRQSINIEEYARSHHMSVSWFIRSFKEYTNFTPAQYLLSLRISNAQTLLESTDSSITEISNLVGYENPFYFSRIFRKQCGMSPSQFRKELEDFSTE